MASSTTTTAAALSVAWDNTIQTMGENFMAAWGPVIDKLANVLDLYNDPYSSSDTKGHLGYDAKQWAILKDKPGGVRKDNEIQFMLDTIAARMARGSLDAATGQARIDAVRAAAAAAPSKAAMAVLVRARRGIFDDNDGGRAVTGAPRAPAGGKSPRAPAGGDPAATSLLPGQAPAAAAAISLKISAPQGTRATVAGATR